MSQAVLQKVWSHLLLQVLMADMFQHLFDHPVDQEEGVVRKVRQYVDPWALARVLEEYLLVARQETVPRLLL